MLSAVSLFPKGFAGVSYWDAYQRIDIAVLVLAVVAILLVLLSVAVLDIACLFGVGAIGSFGLGVSFTEVFEYEVDEHLGAYLLTLGSAALLAGAAIALIPSILGHPKQRQDYAFLPADTGPDTATPTPVEAAPDTATSAAEPATAPATVAGWYPDPSGQARLRYWDGQAWTEQTQQ